MDLYPVLKELELNRKIPRLLAYNRIDGPGSSLDLREFQQCFWTLGNGPDPDDSDPSWTWSKSLPRTVGISIDLGCVVEAHPLADGEIGIASIDYGTDLKETPGKIPYRSDNWLLKALEIFNLTGVRFVLHNLIPGIRSSGLGGSATATTAVCLFANKLAGDPFSADQIVAMAAMLEQDMGISLTGTQEQSCVLYGGVTDFVWYPWGIPGQPGSFGSSRRAALLEEEDYGQLETRMGLYHSGQQRDSSFVNEVWRKKLRSLEGLMLHRSKLTIAYDYREGIRTKDWEQMRHAIREYRSTRQQLCEAYMCESCWDVQGQCERFDAESFPLGAGGGGAIMVFCPDPDKLNALHEVLEKAYRRIDFRICSTGHVFNNLP